MRGQLLYAAPGPKTGRQELDKVIDPVKLNPQTAEAEYSARHNLGNPEHCGVKLDGKPIFDQYGREAPHNSWGFMNAECSHQVRPLLFHMMVENNERPYLNQQEFGPSMMGSRGYDAMGGARNRDNIGDLYGSGQHAPFKQSGLMTAAPYVRRNQQQQQTLVTHDPNVRTYGILPVGK